jgi:hypothetical protein
MEQSLDSEMIDVVQEFMLKQGYFKSLGVFKEEIYTQPNLDAYIRSTPGNSRFGESLLLEVASVYI